jgi:hypothetical protein
MAEDVFVDDICQVKVFVDGIWTGDWKDSKEFYLLVKAEVARYFSLSERLFKFALQQLVDENPPQIVKVDDEGRYRMAVEQPDP